MKNPYPLPDGPDFYSLLWPDEKSSLAVNEQALAYHDYFKDLCLDKMLDRLNFSPKGREKAETLLHNLSTDAKTINYRLDILQDFIASQELRDAFQSFTQAMTMIERNAEDKYTHPEEIHIYTSLYEKAAAFISLIEAIRDCPGMQKGRIQSNGLAALQLYAAQLSGADVFGAMKQAVQQIAVDYDALDGIVLEFGYYDGLKDVVIHTGSQKTEAAAVDHESFISRLLRYAAAFSDDKDRSAFKIYYDVRFSRLERLVLERLQEKRPRLFTKIDAFYHQYAAYALEQICTLKEEIEFYLKMAEMVRTMRQAGLPFCKPELNACDRQKTSFCGLYDISMALQMNEAGCQQLAADIVLNHLDVRERERLFVITGPNKGGKTTFIRSLGLAQVLSQVGCFVPAAAASISLADTIYTHFPQEEILGVKKGRLGEEAARISVIVQQATNRSLVLLNETFSSTRRIDGYELARDLLQILMKINCLGFYVTHFSELACEVDALNQAYPAGGQIANLVAGIDDPDGRGLSGQRTYRISRSTPSGQGYSQDIVLKHGLSAEQLDQLLKTKGYLS
ncbi:MAG: DNA mismatch repair protein MutS [Clostridiaceae bacterium]|nr:DNA mismatch repair protein MutS [Clostridiaceae bacterium]